MRSRFPTLCAEPGCSNRTSDHFCEKHKKLKDRSNARPWSTWYTLTIWNRIKDNFRAVEALRANVCQHIDKSKPFGVCGRPATDIDHIIPHRGNWELFLGGPNYENLQGLCHEHHSEKTRRERQQEA